MPLDPNILLQRTTPDVMSALSRGIQAGQSLRQAPILEAMQRQKIEQGKAQQQQQTLSRQRIGQVAGLAAQAKAIPTLAGRQEFVNQNAEALASIGIDINQIGGLDDASLDRIIGLNQAVNPTAAPSPIKLGATERLVTPGGREIVAAGPTETKIQPKIDKLRSRFDTSRKDLVKTDAAFRKVNSAPQTPVGDMSLIFGFMKLLDPGSTVREGEFATAEQAAGIPTRVKNLYNKAWSGEKLLPEQRAEFIAAARSAFDAQQTSADQDTALILQQADQDNVPREKVIGMKQLRDFEKRAAERLINPVSPPGSDAAPQAAVEILRFDAQGNLVQ